jgi:hypothetical protein
MRHILAGVLTLVIGTPAVKTDVGGEENQPETPEQQYQALLKRYSDALEDYARTYREAKTAEEQQKVVQEKYPWPEKYASKVLELVEKNPRAPFAEEALIWIMTNECELLRFRPWYAHAARYEMIRVMTSGGRRWGILTKEEQDIRSRATDILSRDHVASAKLARVAETLGSSQDEKSSALLHAILDKNPNREVKAEACVALARQMQARVSLLKQLKANPQAVNSVEERYGKDYALKLQKADQAQLEAEAEKLYAELTDKYLPDMKPASVALLCQELYYTNNSEMLLRLLYARGKRHDVRGMACLVLAQVLAGNAGSARDARGAEKMRQESEKLFEVATEKYADVMTAFDGTVGTKAKNELFDLRYLSVGKVAPEVTGADQDGKLFKLSDYKGKIVLLDFWSEF